MFYQVYHPAKMRKNSGLHFADFRYAISEGIFYQYLGL
jgi:hypothetical protein